MIQVQQIVENMDGTQSILDFAQPEPGIKLHSDIDSELKSISLEDIPNIIASTTNTQNKVQPSHLYEREWISNDMVLEDCFSVLQFNILAQGLSSGPDIIPPFPITEDDKKSGGYGGFTDIPNPEVSLDWNLRKWRLLEELSGSSIKGELGIDNGVILHDLIAMEEVDNYENFYEPLLKTYGLEGVYNPKCKAPGVPLGWYSDGSCLFWKTSKFQKLNVIKGSYTGCSQGYLIVVLKHIQSEKLIVTAVTHLKSKENTENEQLRTRQVVELLDKIMEVKNCLKEQGYNSSTLLLGDFNTDPFDTKKITATCIPYVLSKSLKSAYPLRPLSEGDYTTWKIRGPKESKHVIDYIFYDDLECKSILSIPKDDEVEPTRFPGFRYPSDHIAIGAKFSI